jgi:hypothetical protein
VPAGPRPVGPENRAVASVDGHVELLVLPPSRSLKTARARRKKSPRPRRIGHTQGFGVFAATQPSRSFQRPA